MAVKAIAQKDIKIDGNIYKIGEEIKNWRFIRRRTKDALINMNRVEEIKVEKVEVEAGSDE